MNMANGLRVGINPPWGLFSEPPQGQRALLSSIADSGIDLVFLADHVSFRGGEGTDGIVALAAMSGVEPRLGLSLGVYLLALRHPVVAARQIATLAEAAPGRVTIGVGVGGEDRSEFEVCGVDPATRGRRTDAALQIVRRLLAGESVSWHDEFFDLREARILPTPEPPIPFVVGGRSKAALQRAGRLGDGWLAAWCSARRMAEGIQQVEEAAGDRQAPMPDSWSHGIQLWVGVGTDPAEGRRHVARGLNDFYKMPFEPFEPYTPAGTAADIAEFLAPYVEAGARTLHLAAVGESRSAEIETIAEVSRLLKGR